MEVLVALSVLLLAVFLAVFLAVRRYFGEARAPARGAPGLRLVPDSELPLVTQRVHELLRPLPIFPTDDFWRPGPVYSLDVNGRDAYLYQLCYETMAGHNFQRAFVVLGSGAPYLRAAPRGVLGFLERKDPPPVRAIDFPQDRRFSRAFAVEGPDVGAIRSYLGPEMRRFLLAHARGWRFNAGPEGVALVRSGRISGGDLARAALTLERLAAATVASR